MRKWLAISVSTIALAGMIATGAAVAHKTYNIPTIVKIAGIQWFNRMEVGVKKFAKDTGNNSYEVGPPKADAQLQVQLVEDMIAKKADAITVVPFSPEALEPVLAKARAAGIKVVTHEASNIQNADWDLEAFQNVDYGKHQMDLLGRLHARRRSICGVRRQPDLEDPQRMGRRRDRRAEGEIPQDGAGRRPQRDL